jgi:hypothetical protein
MPRPAAADRNAMLLGWKGTCSGRNIFGDGKGDGKETLEADRQRTRDSR